MSTPLAVPAVPVLIVGAGPTGLVLAMVLSINGISVRLIDRALEHRVGSKGAGLQPRTLELLHFLGVLDDILADATPVRPMRFYKMPGGTEIEKEVLMAEEAPPPSPDVPYPTPVLFEQDGLEHILRTDLQRRFGVAVEHGVELLGFEQAEERVFARLKHRASDQKEETMHARYLVGTDGGHSAVRKGLGLSFEGTDHDEPLIYGDAAIKGLDDQYWHRYGNPPGRMVVLRGPGRRGSDRWAITASGLGTEHALRLAQDPAAFERYLREHTGRSDIEVTRWDYLACLQTRIRMVDTFGTGRVYIAGDAAHTHSSAGGQGLNSSVQDSLNLAWKLALALKGHAAPRLLATYTSERAPVIAEMLARSTALLDALLRGDEATARALWRDPALRQLGVHCEWSAGVFDERIDGGRAAQPKGAYGGSGVPGLRAGARAPNATDLVILGDAERSTSLIDLFSLAKHTILVYAGYDAARKDVRAFLDVVRRQAAGTCQAVLVFEQTPQGTEVELRSLADIAVVDSKGHAAWFYEVASGVRAVAVRPDGVVGAMATTPDGLARAFELVHNSTV